MAKSSFNALINSEKPVLIDFYAEWCGPCKMFSPIINNLKEDLGNNVRILKIDIDKNRPLAEKLRVMSIPAIMIYQSGKLKYKGKGVHSLQDLKKKLLPLIK